MKLSYNKYGDLMNKFMTEALKEAKKAYLKNEVPIGAVIEKDGVVIAKAHNLRESKNTAISHAEILCIEKACRKLKSWRLDGCNMYVTLEPCMMCAGAITQSRINRVIIGAMDEKNGCVGSIANLLESVNTTHKVKVDYDIYKECSQIISDFFKELRKAKVKK